MRFLAYLLALYLWQHWYMVGELPVLSAFKRRRLRARLRYALAVNPAAFDARVELARDALSGARFQEAIGYLTPILAKGGDAAEVPRLYGLALLGAGRSAEAVDVFRQALALDRKETEARLGLAQSLFCEGRYDEARAEIEAYRVGRPGDARGSWTEAAIRTKDADGAAEKALGSLRELVSEQRLKPGYARRRDRKWAVRARLALLLRRPPAKV